jgi:hypothetical protein
MRYTFSIHPPQLCTLTHIGAHRLLAYGQGSLMITLSIFQGFLLTGLWVTMILPPRIPLVAGHWGVVYSDEHIYLGEGMRFTLSFGSTDILSELVLTFYSKEAGAGSKHSWQPLTPSISSLSYIVVRAYEGVSNRNSFRLIHSAHAKLRAHKFFHLPSTQFLCRIQDIPTASTSSTLLLSERDWRTFKQMVSCRSELGAAIKKLNASMRGSGKA